MVEGFKPRFIVAAMTYPCTLHCPLQNNQNIPYLVAIVDCTHVGSATVSIQGLGNIAQENSFNQTADVLVRYQVQRHLVLVTVPLKRELHKPNS